MPQLAGAAGIMQIVQMVMPILEKLIDKISEGMQNNKSDAEMGKDCKCTMEDDNIKDTNQQYDTMKQAESEAFNRGKFVEAAVLSRVAELFKD
jgi:hypothetical protein